MPKRCTQATIALVSAVVGLAVIVAIAPHATIVADERPSELAGVDILLITKTAKNLDEQQYASH